MKLREYQEIAKFNIKSEFLQGNNRVILQLPTGAGKTVVFTDIAKSVKDKGGKVLIITDRKELLTQAGGTFDVFGLSYETLTAQTKQVDTSACVHIAMVETIKRRLSKPDYITFVQGFNLIIIDEAHKCSFDKLFSSLTDKQYVIGATATPYRDGKMKPLKEFYDAIVIGQQIRQLIAGGHLSPAIHYGVPIENLDKVKITAGDFDTKQMGELYDNATLFDGVVENYKKHCKGEKALLFCSTVKNSKRMVDEMKQAGIKAMHLDGNTPGNERNMILEMFKNGDFQVLSNVGVLTAGYDESSIKAIIVYRATRSLSLWLQMCGRGSRLHGGKENFKILDFGENTKRLGFWDDDRQWTLERVKPPKKKGIAAVKECRECGALIPSSIVECPYCGHKMPKKKKVKSAIEVMLEQMTPSEINRHTFDNVWELEEARKAKGYKIGWCLHRMKGKPEMIREYAKLKNYKNGWIRHQLQKFK